MPEVEATVERLKAAGAAGARMVGGGFGGSVLALLPPGVARPAGALASLRRPSARLLALARERRPRALLAPSGRG